MPYQVYNDVPLFRSTMLGSSRPQPDRRWRKEIVRHLTIMVVPHGTGRPRQLTFSIPFLLFLMAVWTGLTGWAGYIASERFDYWRMKAHNHVMQLKVAYFANEMKQAREMLDDLKEVDGQLRALIGMGSREAIIQSEHSPLQNAGGPTAQETQDLQNLLEGRVAEMSIEDVARHLQALRSETEKRLASFEEIKAKIRHERDVFRATPNMWPTNGRVSSHFGGRLSPFSGLEEWHNGVDIASPAGHPVRATADGVVQMAGWAGGYGKVVVINHNFGYSTRYGHNRQVLVKRGDHVKRGQIVALVGSTGNATGPHCHYEVWLGGRCVNPRRFMKQDS
jgi:biotin carboxyl carrier protein